MIDDLAGYVATILDKIQSVQESYDRFGKRNWECFGSSDKCWRCCKTFGDPNDGLEPGTQQRHHIVPESEGGTSTEDNIATLCANCHAVVHKFYLPYARLGRNRIERDGGRLVGDFEGGVQITKLLEAGQEHSSYCAKCNVPCTVDGVTEGYWDGEGMLILLTCPKCLRGYADPYIGTRSPPEINRVSQVCSILEHSLNTIDGGLSASDKQKRDAVFQEFMDTLRNFDSQLQIDLIKMQRSGFGPSELQSHEQASWSNFQNGTEVQDILESVAALQNSVRGVQKS